MTYEYGDDRVAFEDLCVNLCEDVLGDLLGDVSADSYKDLIN